MKKEQNQNFITKIALKILDNSRVVMLLLIAFVGFGVFSYTSLLKREGFPEIGIQKVFLSVDSGTVDIEDTESRVIIPLEKALSEVDGLQDIDVTIRPYSSLVQISYSGDEDPKNIYQNNIYPILSDLELPENASIHFLNINPGSYDGLHDLVFSIVGDYSPDEYEVIGQKIASELRAIDEISGADILPLIKTITNPNGTEIAEQTSFNRIGDRIDGELVFQNSLSIGVTVANSDVGVFDLSNAVTTKLDSMQKSGDFGEFKYVLSGDFSVAVGDTIASLESNFITALVIVFFVLFFFVNFRASILALVFIGSVMFSTFTALYLVGYTLNIISLFALILVLGLFVDDIIVVIESIDIKKKQGLKGREALISSLNEIGIADFSGTLTTVLVFFPMALASGVLGDFIRILPLTVILALCISIILALFVMPGIVLFLIPDKKEDDQEGIVNRILHAVSHGILFLSQKLEVFVRWYLVDSVRSVSIFFISLSLLVGGGMFFGLLKFDIFPVPKDTEEIQLNVSFQCGIDLECAEAEMMSIENIITENDDGIIENVYYLEGNASSAFARIILTPIEDRDITSNELVEKLNYYVFQDYENASVWFSVVSNGPPKEAYPFHMQVYGENIDSGMAFTTVVAEYIDGMTVIDGKEATVDGILPINPNVIYRKNGKKYGEIDVKFYDEGGKVGLTRLLDGLEKKITASFDENTLKSYDLMSDDITFVHGMESDNASSFDSMIVAFVFSLVAMYGLLVALYNSYMLPFLILIAAPFAIPGLAVGLYITNNSLGFFSMIGVIGLIGIVVNNSILLLDVARAHVENGKPYEEAIALATGSRFRPIIATTTTTIVSLIPLAISDPFWEPLAYSIIFGLFSSTFLLIVFFPVYYVWVQKLRALLKGGFSKLMNKE